jgi:hypothetical protein
MLCDAKREAGLTEFEEKCEELIPRQTNVEDQILRAKPMKRSDIKKKLAIYDQYDGCREWCGAPVVHHLRRLFEKEITLSS